VSTAPRIGDERGIVGISLIRWVLVLVLMGIVVIEAGSIIFTTIGLQNAADTAALEAADVWDDTGNVVAARAAALESLRDHQQDEARLPADQFEADGSPTFEVRFEVTKQAPTLVVQHISFLKDFAEITVEAKARPVEPGV
jgi:hypothetical protein